MIILWGKQAKGRKMEAIGIGLGGLHGGSGFWRLNEFWTNQEAKTHDFTWGLYSEPIWEARTRTKMSRRVIGYILGQGDLNLIVGCLNVMNLLLYVCS